MPVEVQIWRLSVLFLVGAVSDLLFQSYRAFRAVFRPKRLGYHLLDALAAVVFLAGLGTTVLIINWGELRMYVPVTIFLGALLTHALVGGAAYGGAHRVFVRIRRGLDWSRRRIITPTVTKARRTAAWVKATLFPPLPPGDAEPGEDGDEEDDPGEPPPPQGPPQA